MSNKPSTRSQSTAQETNIPEISENTKQYLEHLINNSTLTMTAHITQLEDKIISLQTEVASLKTENNQMRFKQQTLENSLTDMRRAYDKLATSHDDLENYGRRLNVRVEGVPARKDETEQQLFSALQTQLGEVGVDITETDVVRFHRSAKPRMNKSDVLCQQVIVKFARWGHRRAAQSINKKSREKKLPIRVHNDLTKRRFTLLSRARREIDQRLPNQTRDDNVFAYPDTNSNLIIRKGRLTYPFNTDDELDTIMNDLTH